MSKLYVGFYSKNVHVMDWGSLFEMATAKGWGRATTNLKENSCQIEKQDATIEFYMDDQRYVCEVDLGQENEYQHHVIDSFKKIIPYAIELKVALIIALALAIPLAYLKIYKRNLLIHNFTELLVYPGIAVIFVPILNVFTIISLLILILELVLSS